MTMTDGWIGEQVSTDPTVIPQLEPVVAASTDDTYQLQRPVSPPESTATTRESEGLRIFAGLLLAVGLGVGAYFAWPAIASLLPNSEEAVAAPFPQGRPTQRLVIDGDTLYLEGMVPNENVSQEIESAAQRAIGARKVINNFELSDQAVFDPSQPVLLSVAETVLFSTGRSEVNDEYAPLIDLAVDLMGNQPETTLAVVGHTDDRGAEDVNLKLSIDRATAVADEIESRGVEPERLVVRGRGESEPLQSNDSEEGRSANRRVEFLITGLLQ